jgi:hypothetical protein
MKKIYKGNFVAFTIFLIAICNPQSSYSQAKYTYGSDTFNTAKQACLAWVKAANEVATPKYSYRRVIPPENPNADYCGCLAVRRLENGDMDTIQQDMLIYIYNAPPQEGIKKDDLPPDKTEGPIGNNKEDKSPTGKIVLDRPNSLTLLANKIKGLGQLSGATVQIVQARKGPDTFFVAGINSSARPFNNAQKKELKRLGIKIAPQNLKGKMKGEEQHAEENIAIFLQSMKARGVRWSHAIVGDPEKKRSYICKRCKSLIRLIGGITEDPMDGGKKP